MEEAIKMADKASEMEKKMLSTIKIAEINVDSGKAIPSTSMTGTTTAELQSDSEKIDPYDDELESEDQVSITLKIQDHVGDENYNEGEVIERQFNNKSTVKVEIQLHADIHNVSSSSGSPSSGGTFRDYSNSSPHENVEQYVVGIENLSEAGLIQLQDALSSGRAVRSMRDFGRLEASDWRSSAPGAGGGMGTTPSGRVMSRAMQVRTKK